MTARDTHGLVLLTGATGYVGGRLRRVLEERRLRLRCMAREPTHLRSRVGPDTEVVAGDVLDPTTLGPALAGVHTAYYLIHALGSKHEFEEREARGAEHFARAACDAGVRRIIYLGGLGREDRDLSPHLRSRHAVGRILRESGVPTVIELRASVVVGSGSLSFELVRALVERLPIMITPRWTAVEAQPIAIRDLLDYLAESLDLDLEGSHVFEIGGADKVSYEGLMREYARQRGLRRWMIRVPMITPTLSSLWLGFVTPIFARVGRKLIESIKHPSIVTDDAARRAFSVRPMSMSEAFRRALEREDEQFVETRWHDALSSGGDVRTWVGVRFGNRIADDRSVIVAVPPSRAFAPIRRIGGRTGWYGCNWLWSLRGFVDLLLGGVGTRRGRSHPTEVRVGEALDFWRVEAFEPDRLLRLRAEMKLPGRAWLEFEVTPEPGGSRIRQTAMFDPLGLSGLAYWYLIFPVHVIVFRRMLAGLARAATATKDD